jgi:hypothetical protein
MYAPPIIITVTVDGIEYRMKEVAPSRFYLIGHKTAPYVDRTNSGDHWTATTRTNRTWHDNPQDAIRDALAAEQRRKNTNPFTGKARYQNA